MVFDGAVCYRKRPTSMLAVPKGKGETRTSISAQTKEMSSELRFNAAGGCTGEEEKLSVFIFLAQIVLFQKKASEIKDRISVGSEIGEPDDSISRKSV